MLEYSMTAEPRACAKKYLIALSHSWFICDCNIMGMKASRFSSMEIQANNQLELDKAISVLMTRTEKNSIEDGISCSIRTRRNWTPS